MKTAKQKPIQLFIFLSLLFPPLVFAETITLKSGRRIEGKVLEKTNAYIKIESNGSLLYYEPKYIKSIDTDSPESPSSEQGPYVDPNSYLRQGFKYAAEARFKEAQEQFEKGLGIKPLDHNLKEALGLLDDLKSGAIKEEYAIHLFKGSLALMNAKYEQAAAEFTEALKLDPQGQDLSYYLGVCYYSLSQYPEAIDYLLKAKEKKKDDELYYYLGACYYSLGRYLEAITYMEKVLELNPRDAEACFIIGASEYLLGDGLKAKEDLNKAKALFKDNSDYLKARDVEDFLDRLN